MTYQADTIKEGSTVKNLTIENLALKDPNGSDLSKPLSAGNNIQGGSIDFHNEKQKNISFYKPFTKKPFVDLTLEDPLAAPPYRINVTMIGFTIKTSTKFTGTIEWKAIEL